MRPSYHYYLITLYKQQPTDSYLIACESYLYQHRVYNRNKIEIVVQIIITRTCNMQLKSFDNFQFSLVENSVLSK